MAGISVGDGLQADAIDGAQSFHPVGGENLASVLLAGVVDLRGKLWKKKARKAEHGHQRLPK